MKQCGNCRWFSPVAAKGWKAPAPGDYVTPVMSLLYWLSDNDMRVSSAGWIGKCSAAQAQVDVRSAYMCSRWTVNRQFLSTINDELIHRENRKEIETLRSQLKAERGRSLIRYRKLRKITAKPTPNGEAVA